MKLIRGISSSILALLTRKQHVHELAVGGARAELLDLGHLGLEAAIDPGQHLVPEYQRKHVSNILLLGGSTQGY